MSYTILYRRQFIKVDDTHVIPMLEQGDNNVWEADNKRRARDWGSSYGMTNGKLIIANDELLANIDKFREDTIKNSEAYVKEHGDSWAYNDNKWGYHVGVALGGRSTSGTTFSAYKSFYANGIKTAMTIEELREHDVTVTIYVYRWKDEDITKLGLEIKPDVTFTSTQHMVDTIKEFTDYYAGHKVSIHLRYTGIEWLFRERKRERHNAKIDKRVAKKQVTVEEYYALKFEQGYYDEPTRKGGFRYNERPEYGKGFMTEKEANKFNDKLKKNTRNMASKFTFTVEKITKPRTFLV